MRVRWLLIAAVSAAALLGASPATAGAAGTCATEQLWQAGTDDWEPTVAADPSSSFVYQMTTRYGGQKACGKGLGHCIILRASSNGGATWGTAGRMPATV